MKCRHFEFKFSIFFRNYKEIMDYVINKSSFVVHKYKELFAADEDELFKLRQLPSAYVKIIVKMLGKFFAAGKEKVDSSLVTENFCQH